MMLSRTITAISKTNTTTSPALCVLCMWPRCDTSMTLYRTPARLKNNRSTMHKPFWVYFRCRYTQGLDEKIIGNGKSKDIAVRNRNRLTATEIHMPCGIGLHSATCRRTAVIFPPLPQPKWYSI